MTLSFISILAIGIGTPIAIGVMVFKDKSTSIREGATIVALTWGSLYGSAFPQQVPPLVTMVLTVAMWVRVAGVLSGNVARRLEERVARLKK